MDKNIQGLWIDAVGDRIREVDPDTRTDRLIYRKQYFSNPLALNSSPCFLKGSALNMALMNLYESHTQTKYTEGIYLRLISKNSFSFRFYVCDVSFRLGTSQLRAVPDMDFTDTSCSNEIFVSITISLV